MAEPPKNGVQMVVFLTEVDFSLKTSYKMMNFKQCPLRTELWICNIFMNNKNILKLLEFIEIVETGSEIYEFWYYTYL